MKHLNPDLSLTVHEDENLFLVLKLFLYREQNMKSNKISYAAEIKPGYFIILFANPVCNLPWEQGFVWI